MIVTDDGSYDDTVEIVKNFIKDNQLKNWRIIENTANLGYSKNFEKCVSLCSGDVIFLCDQDDIWAPEKVREMLTVFERYEDCLSIVTNFKLINSNGEPLFDSQNDNCWCYSKKMKKVHDCLYKIDLIEVLNHNVASGCTQAIRKRIVDNFLNCKYKTTHDYRFSLIAALNGALYYLDKPLIEYRIHENNNIGYPSYCLMRKNREKKKLVKQYFIFIYNALLGNNPLDYHRKEKIDWLESTYKDNPCVNRWAMFARNREMLYSSEKKRLKHYIAQKIHFREELKTVTYTNDRYERFMLCINDLQALMHLRGSH